MSDYTLAERDADVQQEILIVEDERLIALEIKFHLKRWGYRIAAEFSSAEQALEFLSQRHRADDLPSLVLMDIQLAGEMDGVGAATIIRERFSLPVVVLTAYADETTLNRAKLSEPYAYIIKPIHARELKTALILALYRNRMERAIRSRERCSRVSSPRSTAASFSVMRPAPFTTPTNGPNRFWTGVSRGR